MNDCGNAHDNKSLYHYTTMKGLLGILGEQNIWATHIKHLNDRKEFGHAVDMIRKRLEPSTALTMIESFLNEFSDITYICSFSEYGNQLSQWRSYCPIGGYSIGFARDKLQKLRQSDQNRGTLTALSQCKYSEEEQRDTLNDVVGKYEANSSDFADLQTKLAFIAPTFKDDAFREEREWRLIVTLTNFHTIEFREGKTSIIPYWKFCLRQKDGALPITSIIIGPTPNPKESEFAVRRLLKRYEMSEDILVEDSKIPYREI